VKGNREFVSSTYTSFVDNLCICSLHLFMIVLQERDMEKLKDFIETKKPHVIAVTAENM